MKRIIIGWLCIMAIYLGIHNGHVALWDAETEEPLAVFPYSTAIYPEADRHALTEGIPIPDMRSMSQLMEDYFS